MEMIGNSVFTAMVIVWIEIQGDELLNNTCEEDTHAKKNGKGTAKNPSLICFFLFTLRITYKTTLLEGQEK